MEDCNEWKKEDFVSKMHEEFKIRSQKLRFVIVRLYFTRMQISQHFSLLQNTIDGIDNEIEAVKSEIRTRIDKKSELLEKQISLLGKIRELDLFKNDIPRQQQETSNQENVMSPDMFEMRSHSLMVSGNFACQPTELVVRYFERYGKIVKVTDKCGFNSKNGFKFIFLKFDRVEPVDLAVHHSPHRINGQMYQARRGKDY